MDTPEEKADDKKHPAAAKLKSLAATIGAVAAVMGAVGTLLVAIDKDLDVVHAFHHGGDSSDGGAATEGGSLPTSTPTDASSMAAAALIPAVAPSGLTGARSPAAGTMLNITAGMFLMGSPDGLGSPNEEPQHLVKVAAFRMDATEVTVSEYAGCVRAGTCAAAPTEVEWPGMTDAYRAVYSQFCNAERSDRANHPINCVNWSMASIYCRWAGKRLPTEEEWEYAARGSDGRTYPWGNADPGPALLNGCDDDCVAAARDLGQAWATMYPGHDGAPFTAPVGSYPEGKSPFGLLDMAGNVWEWTASGWSDGYSKPRSDKAKVYRGGGWASFVAVDARAAHRARMPPTARGHGLGFRCAK